jgi:anaerobic selenocysteine-containing dehydrogenase
MSTQRTFCRLCEVGCGLVAEVVDGRIERLRPDHEHPATAGFACKKGLVALDVHRDPDRLDVPLARQADGGFLPVGWDDALAGIGARLRAIVEESGPSAVAVYVGNPTAFNASSQVGMGLFMLGLGGGRMFSSGTQDCSNKFAVAEVLYGSMQLHPVADLDHTHHALLLGTNPRISGGSFVQRADTVSALRAIGARGGTVRFVNPVAIEPDLGETVQLRPDTDAYLLAAMLHEIERRQGFDEGALAGHTRHLDVLRTFVAPYSPEVVAPVVGIPAAKIAAMADEFASAPSACAHMSTGVNMGRQGALAYWLVQMLVLVTGNLDRRGGTYLPARALPVRPFEPPATDFVESRWGSYRPSGTQLPGALLADMIEDTDEPVRALIVLAGNPLLTMTGADRLEGALGSLDLLVSLDIYRNATGELAHYVLPCTDQYERGDLNTFVQGMQLDPFVQWTDRVVPPAGERRTEFRIFGDLVRAMGRDPLVDPETPDPLALVYDGGLASCGLSVAELASRPAGFARIAEDGPGTFLDRALLGDGVLDCAPAPLLPSLERAHMLFDELAAEPSGQVKLIARRTRNTLNSWFQNVERLRDARSDGNPLFVHPDDAARLDVTDGVTVRVYNEHGCVHAPVRIDPTLRPGVVAMTHGFGNDRTTGMRVAQQHPGSNVNVLTPSGAGTFDPFSSMSHLTGIPVEVVPIS